MSETRDAIVFISMQNLQDVKVLNHDRDTAMDIKINTTPLQDAHMFTSNELWMIRDVFPYACGANG